MTRNKFLVIGVSPFCFVFIPTSAAYNHTVWISGWPIKPTNRGKLMHIIYYYALMYVYN